ncbi:MAG: dTDP-4-dehydrorhamnose reductase [Bacteroidales bacterium]|nr:dTDP-4-dehydrorhamnose reductase [Bacteroidales bacterium]
MNILVTGCNGQLGRHVRKLGEQNSQHRWFFTDVEELDITHREEVLNRVFQDNINVIVNCAAYTNVDRAEDDEVAADLLNHIAVRNLAEAMKVVNGTLVHISTDYVFGGGLYNKPCTEEMLANPTGAYGRTKLAGEQAVQETGCRYLIFRTAWLYSEYGTNFVKTMLRVMSEKERCNVVFDQVGTPTYAGDLAKAIVYILDNDMLTANGGIYHYSNEGVCSWYDFAKEIARQAHITTCEIQPCHSCDFPSKVVRPPFSVLDKSKVKQTFGVSVPYWTDSLQNCLTNLKLMSQPLQNDK